MNVSISISVGSSRDYESLIAEIKFGQIGGVIISKELQKDRFMISLHSFLSSAEDDFDFNRNRKDDKIDLDEFLSAILSAKLRLSELE
jgi:hypothetical protein